jgi:hypothetical protein
MIPLLAAAATALTWAWSGAPPAPPPAAPAPPPGAVPRGARPSMTAARAPGPVKLDGRLDEPAWAAAPATDAFTQQYPDDGAAPAERTEARILYDDRALYVGITCAQTTRPVIARLTRRDRVVPGDRVTVDISSRADRVTAFHFGVNAAGVLEDGIYFDDTTYSADWDENWQAATSVDAGGWTVEIRIPFRVLRFDAAATTTTGWGLQIQRYTELRHEWDLWAFRPRSAPGVVSTFGVLGGLVGIRPPLPFEVRFNEALRLRFRDAQARGALAPPHDWTFQPGLDGKAHPTQGTTLDLTINPDFGQVEADQVVLNLSTYELFLPEKRPFFLEGLDALSTTRSVLYTRRIGGQPANPLIAATGETLVDDVGPSRIWAAAKLVGVVANGTSVALLSALTGENDAQVVLAAPSVPDRVSRVADPLTVYNVLRARHAFGLAGDVGFLATSTNRFERPGGYPAARFMCPNRPPTDQPASMVAARCFNDAYVAAVDGRWRSPSTDYLVAGQLVGGMLAEGPARPQRDGISIEPEHPSVGGTLTAAKQGGAHWLATTSQSVSGRQLDYNDLGYLDRKNDYQGYADLTYRTLEPWGSTTDTSTTLAAAHRQTLDGLRLADDVRVTASVTFTSFWVVSAALYYHAAHFDDREAGDGTALERAGLGGLEVWLGSDSRRLVSGSAWMQIQDLADGVQAQGIGSLTVRPHPRIELELDPAFLYANGEPRFVGNATLTPMAPSSYVFGRLRASNLGVTVRATVGILPTLTFQLYSQLFLATKQFSGFATATGGPRVRVHLADLQPFGPAPPSGLADPDSEQVVLNVNAVLRWEYRLGSVIYVVYTRAQSPTINLTTPPAAPRLDLGPLRGNQGSVDAVMVKASYWWG